MRGLRYLTNTSLDNEERCKWAAKQSGQNVRFSREPMPKDGHFGLHWPYDPANLTEPTGCLIGDDGWVDYSDFWEAWRAYPTRDATH